MILAVYRCIPRGTSELREFSETRIYETIGELCSELDSESAALTKDWWNSRMHEECLLRDCHDKPSVILKRIA